MDNTFEIEVLPDGRIKTTAKGGFSEQYHQSADEFLKFINDAAGGQVETKKLAPHLGSHQHTHEHGHGGHHHHHH